MKKIIIWIFVLFSVSQICLAQQNLVREPAVAGTFYPANSKDISKMVDNYFSRAKVVSSDFEIFGLISPHAGYVYSGIVAAQSYKQIMGRAYDIVIVISPSHVEYFPFSSVMEKGIYKTPLGRIKVDQELAKKIAKGRKTVRLSKKGHFQTHLSRREHSLEVQLPFLQKVLHNFSFVPIVMGEQSYQACKELAEAVYQATKGRKTLIVASSDLSHFHSYQQAEQIDGGFISLVKQFNYKTLYNRLQAKNIEACGGAPIITMLMATQKMGAGSVRILMYANSGDTAGDRSSVVGYLSAIIGKPKKQKARKTMDAIYSPEERKELLKIARISIENSVKRSGLPEVMVKSDKLKEKRGAFVTITKFGQLRGCIGYTQPIFPLYQTIQQVAKAAALEDPRFPAVDQTELENLEIEISVLTLPKKIKDTNQIEVGKHGLIIKQGYKQGLLLPQVATDYNWDRTTFLEQTCRKAGLPENAWKDPKTEIFIFSGEVFGEH